MIGAKINSNIMSSVASEHRKKCISPQILDDRIWDISHTLCTRFALYLNPFFTGKSSWSMLCYFCCSATLTHWGRVRHICVGKLTIIDSDNGLSPDRRQAIIWTNAGILIIGPWGTNFSEILVDIKAFSLKKMHLKISSAKWRPFCLGLNVLTGTLKAYW